MSSAYAANLAFTRVGGSTLYSGSPWHIYLANGSWNLWIFASSTAVHVGPILSSVLLINIVGQASIDYQSTICQVSNRRDTHSGYYVTVVHRVHRLEANQHQQSAHTRRNRPIRHQESGGKSYGTDTANYGWKAPTQWTSRSCATPEIAEEFHQMHRAHQHDSESCSLGVMERTTRAPGRQCAP